MSYRVTVTVTLTLLLGLWLALAGVCTAAQRYSADIFWQTGKQTVTGKIYVTVGRTRFEAGGATTISRLDQSVAWLLIPSEKMYMEQSLRPEQLSPADPLPGEISRTGLGSESVNGTAANKYRVVVKSDGRQQTLLVWLSAADKLPLRMAAGDDSWMVEYRNVQPGDPEDSLFEIPEGYKKFGMNSYFSD